MQCLNTHRGDGVEGSVGTDAKVRARDVVGDSGRDDHHRNAHLLIFFSCLNHLQASNVGLWQENRRKLLCLLRHVNREYRSLFHYYYYSDNKGNNLLSYFKTTNDHQSMNVKLGNVLADFLQEFAWKSSLRKADKLFSKNEQINEKKKITYVFLSFFH